MKFKKHTKYSVSWKVENIMILTWELVIRFGKVNSLNLIRIGLIMRRWMSFSSMMIKRFMRWSRWNRSCIKSLGNKFIRIFLNSLLWNHYFGLHLGLFCFGELGIFFSILFSSTRGNNHMMSSPIRAIRNCLLCQSIFIENHSLPLLLPKFTFVSFNLYFILKNSLKKVKVIKSLKYFLFF